MHAGIQACNYGKQLVEQNIFWENLHLIWAQINKENKNRIKNGKESETNTI